MSKKKKKASKKAWWLTPDTFPGKQACPKCGSVKWRELHEKGFKGKLKGFRCTECPDAGDHH
jgi:ssDNA-binding Zn-finger/Zn-ribbon topoisomerase 1